MSLVITLFVPEGLVMAADSRLTLEFKVAQQDGSQKTESIPSSDSTYKVFLLPHNIGVSAYGAASVGVTPIAPLVEVFAATKLKDVKMPPDKVASELLSYFRKLEGPPASIFHVAGYKDGTQQVFEANVSTNTTKSLITSGAGAAWGGEADALLRLLSKVGTLDQAGNKLTDIQSFGVAFDHFTLQDAIDFAVYAIRTTADTMRFQLRRQTVGGPIDLLIIRPDGARWLRRKELRVVDDT